MTACSSDAQSTRQGVAPAVQLAAQGGQTSSAATTAPAQSSDTLARIRALIGTPTCSEDSQCRSLPLGARACGGPEGYLPWSTARTPEAELRALGELYKAERQAQNKASGMVSDCRFLADPGAVCRAGTCQPGDAGLQAR